MTNNNKRVTQFRVGWLQQIKYRKALEARKRAPGPNMCCVRERTRIRYLERGILKGRRTDATWELLGEIDEYDEGKPTRVLSVDHMPSPGSVSQVAIVETPVEPLMDDAYWYSISQYGDRLFGGTIEQELYKCACCGVVSGVGNDFHAEKKCQK